MPLSAAKIEDDTLASGCSASRLMSSISFYLLLSSSISFYIKEDMPLSAAKIEDDTLVSGCSASRLMSFISFYLHLPPSISFFLQGKRNLRNLNYKIKQAQKSLPSEGERLYDVSLLFQITL